MKFYIYAPSYNENSGGCIALHKLAHIINSESEHEAYLVPRVLEKIRYHGLRELLLSVKTYINLLRAKKNYKTNIFFNSPVVKAIPKSDLNSAICVYPEVTFGNPLQAKNVVRWFLHQPGNFSKEICFGIGELYYKFNSAIKDFELYGSKLSDNELKVIHYPLEIYNTKSIDIKRNRTCHMFRKGKHKKSIHGGDSICLDGLSHSEVADVFKQCDTFISYDDYTAYSVFAILCGCRSIVVPDENISIEQWYPNEKDRFGISYGFEIEQLNWAETTKDKVKELIIAEHARSVSNVHIFIDEVSGYFVN